MCFHTVFCLPLSFIAKLFYYCLAWLFSVLAVVWDTTSLDLLRFWFRLDYYWIKKIDWGVWVCVCVCMCVCKQQSQTPAAHPPQCSACITQEHCENNFNFNSLFLKLVSLQKILDGRNIHPCYLPLVWNHRSRRRSVAFLCYRWWFEKIRFLASGIICMWQAWSVSIIHGGNHSISLGTVQSAPCWAASLMPGIQSNTERLARDNTLSNTLSSNTILFF